MTFFGGPLARVYKRYDEMLPKMSFCVHAHPKNSKPQKTQGRKMAKTRNRSEDRDCNFETQLRSNVAETVVSHARKQKNPQPKISRFLKAPFSGAETHKRELRQNATSKHKNYENMRNIPQRNKAPWPTTPPSTTAITATTTTTTRITIDYVPQEYKEHIEDRPAGRYSTVAVL